MIDMIKEVKRVLEMEGQAILHCASQLQEKFLSESIQKSIVLFQQSLEQGGKIIVTGVGKSGIIGKKIASTLSSTGSLAVFLHPTDCLHGDLGIITHKDSILALSHTGNTEELMRMVPSFKSLGVPLIGLGGNRHSQLAESCDAWIDGSVTQEACPHNLAPTSSTTLALALGDALAVALMQLRGFDAEKFAKNHPGGSLGKRLSLTVAALMHSGDSIPVVAPQASIDEILIVNTLKKMGAVLVVEHQRLVGIITDGDLRRALKHREGFFKLQATDLMTRNPVVSTAGRMASSALDLMENRASQINVLPVVDLEGHPIGIIRVHDLIKNL
jgi:arabinose-5-phosphate isomerase